MIVRNVSKGYAPFASCSLQYGVTGIWRARLDFVKNRFGIRVSRATNTAGIDDEAAIAEAYDALNMCMGTKDQ